MIAFMGEERVLRGGDNVFVAATEASLSEIKHDEPVEPDEESAGKGKSGAEAGDEGGLAKKETPPCPRDFLHPRRLVPRLSLDFEGGTRGWCTLAFTCAGVKTAISGGSLDVRRLDC